MTTGERVRGIRGLEPRDPMGRAMGEAEYEKGGWDPDCLDESEFRPVIPLNPPKSSPGPQHQPVRES